MLLERPASPLGDWLLVGCYEVTREEFGQPVDSNSANLPVAMVSFDEANTWSLARGLRLPTLKEWQYLASDSGRSASVLRSTRRKPLGSGSPRAAESFWLCLEKMPVG